MATYKCTIFFQIRTYGWSESYYLSRGDNSITNAAAQLASMLNLRAQLLGFNAFIIGYRVSDNALRGDGYATTVNLGGVSGCITDGPSVALLCRFRNASGLGGKSTYLRGIPDEVVYDGGQFQPGGCPQFVTSFGAWAQTMTAGRSDGSWGWWGRPNPKPLAVGMTGYTINPANNQVTITFDEAMFLNSQLGTKQTVFFSGVNSPFKSALAGNQVVQVTGLQTCVLYKRMALFPYYSGGQGIFIAPIFNGFQSVQPQRITSRKAGRAFFVERGRAPVRGRG